ncbi:hypothetical protein VHEMI08254 [[Torrubiella] hemipterigena]|uniref:Reverse transcriptase domain-containing protein n=1 Tax=[Torrubiella] hemipterigena TaxID=1531966 RepID=A0A0A1TMV6_9HYPO|nr:hypothetical protein VHEMI08254 [[Torrubiella] hemipterigena]
MYTYCDDQSSECRMTPQRASALSQFLRHYTASQHPSFRSYKNTATLDKYFRTTTQLVLYTSRALASNKEIFTSRMKTHNKDDFKHIALEARGKKGAPYTPKLPQDQLEPTNCQLKAIAALTYAADIIIEAERIHKSKLSSKEGGARESTTTTTTREIQTNRLRENKILSYIQEDDSEAEEEVEEEGEEEEDNSKRDGGNSNNRTEMESETYNSEDESSNEYNSEESEESEKSIHRKQIPTKSSRKAKSLRKRESSKLQKYRQHMQDIDTTAPLEIRRAIAKARREVQEQVQELLMAMIEHTIGACQWASPITSFAAMLSRQITPSYKQGEGTTTTPLESIAISTSTMEEKETTLYDTVTMSTWQRYPLPWDETISKKEVQDALLSIGNTTPGMDNITTKMLRVAWPSIGDAVTMLYNGCLQLGYHPMVFKSAEVVMIPKPNKRDLSNPSAWRPISLLPCLSKGLERVLARRIAYMAVTHDIIPPELAGALPRRSAVDIVSSLVFDIESKVFKNHLVATLVTMDVKGAFDAVLRNRLIQRLHRQG